MGARHLRCVYDEASRVIVHTHTCDRSYWLLTAARRRRRRAGGCPHGTWPTSDLATNRQYMCQLSFDLPRHKRPRDRPTTPRNSHPPTAATAPLPQRRIPVCGADAVTARHTAALTIHAERCANCCADRFADTMPTSTTPTTQLSIAASHHRVLLKRPPAGLPAPSMPMQLSSRRPRRRVVTIVPVAAAAIAGIAIAAASTPAPHTVCGMRK